MAEDRKAFVIKEDDMGEITVAEEVVAIIAGIASTEVEGVSSMSGNITNEIVAKLGMKNLSKGVKVEMNGNNVNVLVSIIVDYQANVPEVSRRVQERVKTSIENMTGLNVAEVNVKIAGIDVSKDN
ncbi:MAG: Asp23/Gls24 family envelope stress response protein [Lachnospiraceae bacterium]|nr:Asp23/Gls24 family envelope stress response protein [Lachnospiraceae bacterium]